MAKADDKPLSENEADDRLKAAQEVLGKAPGGTVAADTALSAARRALHLISLGLIAAGVKRDFKEANRIRRSDTHLSAARRSGRRGSKYRHQT